MESDARVVSLSANFPMSAVSKNERKQFYDSSILALQSINDQHLFSLVIARYILIGELGTCDL